MNPPNLEMAPDGQRSSKYRFVIAGLILFAHFSVGLNFFVVAPLLPLIIDHYQINLATASLLIALALLVHSFFGLPGGIIAVRFGLKRVYFLSWVMVGLPVLSALAPNFMTLLMLRLVYGIGFGAIFPASGPLLMQWFRPREITIMNGLDIAALSLGVALSVFVAAPLANAVGWQNTLSVFGGIPLFGAAAWGIFGRVESRTRATSAGIPLKEVWSVLRNRTILLLVAADALVFMQYTALTSWLPTFYNELRGMSLSQAGFVTGLLPLVGVFAVLAGGFLPLRFASRRPFFVVPGLLLGLGGLGSFLIDGTVGIYVSIVLLGIGSWSYAPTLLSLPMELPDMTPERVAVVWGTFVTVSGLGMFVSPIVVGVVRDASGSFVPGFMIFAIGAWFLVIAGFFMPKTSAKHET
jgi:cyanate permease